MHRICRRPEKERIACEVVAAAGKSGIFGGLFCRVKSRGSDYGRCPGGRIISGQVDRLVIEKDRVLLVDYKTNRPAAKSVKDIPPAYRKQMQAYKDLLAQDLPEKRNHSAALYGEVPPGFDAFARINLNLCVLFNIEKRFTILEET